MIFQLDIQLFLNSMQTTDNREGDHDNVGLIQARHNYIVLFNAPNLIPRTSPKKSWNETNTIP